MWVHDTLGEGRRELPTYFQSRLNNSATLAFIINFI